MTVDLLLPAIMNLSFCELRFKICRAGTIKNNPNITKTNRSLFIYLRFESRESGFKLLKE